MARMNEDGQWIVLMGLLVAVGLFFLALVVNQSVIVGQTTAEGVIEFPKNDIRDLREAIMDFTKKFGDTPDSDTIKQNVQRDIVTISLERKNAVVDFEVVRDKVEVSGHLYHPVTIHYNNGVTNYSEFAYF